jgi:hypothetical protein
MISKGDLERVNLENLADGISEVRPDKTTRKKNRSRRNRKVAEGFKTTLFLVTSEGFVVALYWFVTRGQQYWDIIFDLFSK